MCLWQRLLLFTPVDRLLAVAVLAATLPSLGDDRRNRSVFVLQL